jgi:PAS domain S-box-containing protein
VSDPTPGTPPESGRVAFEREGLVEALRARERFFDTLLGSLETFFTVDADWRVTFANRAAAAMAGTTQGGVVGQDVRELMGDGPHGQSGEHLQRAMAQRVSVDYEATSPGGSVFHGKVYPLHDGGLAVYVRDVSEQARAEEARAVAERQYQELVHSVNSAIVRWSRDGTLTFFNESAERLFGWRADEVVGRRVSILLPGADDGGGDLAHLVADIVAHPDRYLNHVNENVRKDGTRLWVAWTNKALRDDDGEVREVLAVGNDVTELVRTQAALRASEEALRESERRLQIATQASALGVYEYDLRSGAVHWDSRCREIWGVAPHEAVDLDTFLLGVHPDDGERVQSALEEVLAPADDGRFRETYRVVSREGDLRWVVSAGIVVYEDGVAVRLVGTVEDITERRRLEEAVRESEERLNLALSVVGIATWDYHVDTGEVIWNDQHFTMLGYRPREVEPGYEAFLARVHPDDAAAVDRAFRASLEQAADYRAEFRVLRPGGDVRYISAAGHLELDSAGAPLRQYGVMLDLTERRRDEQALLDAEAEKVAQEERGRLARDLHDSVTQALFAVSLKAEALTTGEGLSAVLAADVEEVSRLSRGALAQMRSMLLELRGDPLDQVPLEHLLRNAVEATESRTRTDVDLAIEGSGTLPAVLHVAMYRITQEALNNVARHAQAASAEVRLQLSDSHVRLTIRDDGCGFEPVPMGPSHLGLRSMRERAAEAGARFTLVTEPGGGTLVRVDWDAGDVDEAAGGLRPAEHSEAALGEAARGATQGRVRRGW